VTIERRKVEIMDETTIDEKLNLAESVEGVIEAYLAAVNERDGAARGSLLKTAVADGFVFTGIVQQAEGREAFDRLIAEFLVRYSEEDPVQIVRTTEVDAHHGWVRFGWSLQTASGDTATTPEGEEIAGWYVGQLAPDGRLACIVSF
jgi:hypothetical protein